MNTVRLFAAAYCAWIGLTVVFHHADQLRYARLTRTIESPPKLFGAWAIPRLPDPLFHLAGASFLICLALGTIRGHIPHCISHGHSSLFHLFQPVHQHLLRRTEEQSDSSDIAGTGLRAFFERAVERRIAAMAAAVRSGAPGANVSELGLLQAPQRRLPVDDRAADPGRFALSSLVVRSSSFVPHSPDELALPDHEHISIRIRIDVLDRVARAVLRDCLCDRWHHISPGHTPPDEN